MAKRSPSTRSAQSIHGVIDRLSLKTLVGSMALVITLSALMYYVGNCFDGGIKPSFEGPPADFLDCLYFSIITISSLGYGDFRPIGYSRLVAGTEVTLGLVLFALFVAKLSSERQSKLIRLTYSNDIHKVLKDYRARIILLGEETQTFFVQGHIPEAVDKAGHLDGVLGSLKSYLLFQMEEGMLLEVYPVGQTRGLVVDLIGVASRFQSIFKSGAIPKELLDRLLSVVRLAGGITAELRKRVHDPKLISTCNALTKLIERCEVIVAGQRDENGNLVAHPITKLSPALTDAIERGLPPFPWARDLHKKVAADFAISNHLALQALSDIEARKLAADECGESGM